MLPLYSRQLFAGHFYKDLRPFHFLLRSKQLLCSSVGWGRCRRNARMQLQLRFGGNLAPSCGCHAGGHQLLGLRNGQLRLLGPPHADLLEARALEACEHIMRAQSEPGAQAEAEGWTQCTAS